MLTIHAAQSLRTAPGRAPLVDGAVAVDAGVIVGIGVLAELVQAHPGARLRRWPGELRPGAVQDGTREMLQQTYHPDPRDEGRPPDRSESLRRGIHALLQRGVTAVVDDSTDLVVRAALDRSGLVRVPAGTVPALVPGSRADLAVFDDEGRCLATVLAGRLVHRRA